MRTAYLVRWMQRLHKVSNIFKIPKACHAERSICDTIRETLRLHKTLPQGDISRDFAQALALDGGTLDFLGGWLYSKFG
jgi:hypothetical protein